MELIDLIVTALWQRADPSRAPAMQAYMRDQFPFLGVPAPERRAACRDAVRFARTLSENSISDLVRNLFALSEREFHYVACDLVVERARTASPAFLGLHETLLQTKPWWDTVDTLSHGVGTLVIAHPKLIRVLDRWIEADDRWIVRAALLHQLGAKEQTDAIRLFRYCYRRRADSEFFIRKAIGWALREYSYTDPAAVRAFVDELGDELSGLSRREALRRVERKRVD